MRTSSLAPLLLGPLLFACSRDAVTEAASFPEAVEAVKEAARSGEVAEAVTAYKSLWESFPEDVGREGAYKITLSVYDEMLRARLSASDKIVPMIDLIHWAQVKHPTKSVEFGRTIEALEALGGTEGEVHEMRVMIASNPYLGGGK